MELLKGSSKIVILVLVTIALVSPPDQCEAATCYKCPEKCDDATANTEECQESLTCSIFRFTKADGTVRVERGCTSSILDECKDTVLGFGKAEGCEKATGPKVKECGSAFAETDVLDFCTCKGDKCNTENLLEKGSSENGGDGGGGGDGPNKANSLKWTVTEAGLMMASLLIAAATGTGGH